MRVWQKVILLGVWLTSCHLYASQTRNQHLSLQSLGRCMYCILPLFLYKLWDPLPALLLPAPLQYSWPWGDTWWIEVCFDEVHILRETHKLPPADPRHVRYDHFMNIQLTLKPTIPRPASGHITHISWTYARLVYTETWNLSVFKSLEQNHCLRPLYRSTCDSWHLQLRTGALCWCKCLMHTLADGNQRIRIREKTLEFSSTVLSTLSLYRQVLKTYKDI